MRFDRIPFTPRLALFALAVVFLGGCGSTRLVRTGDPMQDLQSPDPLIVREACVIAKTSRNSDTIPLLVDNLLSDDPTIRSACYACFLDLVAPRLGPQLDTAARLFNYSFALPPKESAQSVERIRAWHRTFTGNPTEDLQANEPITVQLSCLQVSRDEDLDAIPLLIANLRRDDFDVRSFSYTAFVALVSPEDHDPGRVHQTFGYRADAPESERDSSADAIDAWYSTLGRAAIEAVKAKRRSQEGNASPAPSAAEETSDN